MNKPKKSGVLKKIFLVFAGLTFLLLLLGVLITRDFFLRSVVLPRAGNAMEADLSASAIHLNPFSRLEIRDFSLVKHDETLDAKFAGLRFEFSLIRLLQGEIGFDLLEITEPDIHQRVVPPEEAPPKKEKPVRDEPQDLHINIGEIRIVNGSVTLRLPDQILTLGNIDLHLQNLVADKPGQLSLSADTLLDLKEQGSLRTRTALRSEFTLGANLLPESVQLGLDSDILGADGLFEGIADLSALKIKVDATPDTLRKAEFSARNPAGDSLGLIELSGPFDAAAKHADLALRVRDIGPALLNLLGAPAGVSFGDTRLTADALLEIADGGNRLNASAAVRGERVQVRTAEFESPALDVDVKQEVRVDLSAQSADLRELSAQVRNGQQEELISLKLDAPTKVFWDQDPPRMDALALILEFGNLRVEDWKAWLPPELNRGTLSGRADVTVADQGQELKISARTRVEDLGFTLEDQARDSLDLTLETRAAVSELKTLNLESLSLRTTHRGDALAELQSQGTVELPDGKTGLTAEFSLDPVILLRLLPEPPPGLTLREGKLSGSLDLTLPSFESAPAMVPSLTLEIADGRFQEHALRDLRLRVDADASPDGDIYAVSLNLALDHEPAGETPLPLPPFKLAGNFTVSPEKFQTPDLTLSWQESTESDNRLTLEGHADYADPEAVVFEFTLGGERVDLSPWIPKSDPPIETDTIVAADPPAEPAEPDPVTLPVRDGSLRVNIASLRLHELQFEELNVHTVIDPTTVEVKTLSLMLNNTPFTASGSVDTGVKGMAYQLQAELNPLELNPLMQLLAPEQADQFSGVLEADFALSGAGITGPSLRSNLKGHFNAHLRNSEISIRDLTEQENEGVKSFGNILDLLLRGLATALRVSSSDLLDPHLEELRFITRIESGELRLEEFKAGTEVIRILSSGLIVLEDDLTASRIRDIPVQIALHPDLARRARLYREDRLKDERIALPPFVQIRGTLGDPDIDIRRSVLTGLIAGGVTESGLIRSERARDALGGLGGILTGEGPRPTPTPKPEEQETDAEPRPTPAPEPKPEPTPTPRPSGRTDRILRGLDRILGPE